MCLGKKKKKRRIQFAFWSDCVLTVIDDQKKKKKILISMAITKFRGKSINRKIHVSNTKFDKYNQDTKKFPQVWAVFAHNSFAPKCSGGSHGCHSA